MVSSRKNALFACGDDGGASWADLASLIETCKLNGVNPQVYFTDLLTRLVNGWPQQPHRRAHAVALGTCEKRLSVKQPG